MVLCVVFQVQSLHLSLLLTVSFPYALIPSYSSFQTVFLKLAILCSLSALVFGYFLCLGLLAFWLYNNLFSHIHFFHQTLG